ncbi:MAG: hypothetical protein WBC70_14580 [Candidatus Aminicenantales bacterium]
MGTIRRVEIVAASIDEWLICEKCITKEEWDALTEDDFVLESERDKTDDLMFCDRCKKRI